MTQLTMQAQFRNNRMSKEVAVDHRNYTSMLVLKKNMAAEVGAKSLNAVVITARDAEGKENQFTVRVDHLGAVSHSVMRKAHKYLR